MAHCAEIPNTEAQARFHRRRHPRHTLRSLAYVTFENGNGGIVRDLTESGIAIQAVAPLRVGQEVGLRFDLLSPRTRVEASGRVAWADVTGQAGIQFHALPARLHRALKDWLLYQMLSTAAISGRDTIFDFPDPQLLVSTAERPAIVLETQAQASEDSVRIPWGWVSFSTRSLALCVDSLVLGCGVLLFAVSALVVMGSVPAWPLAAALLITSSAIFVAVYQIIFSDFVWGATPGERLAALVARGSPDDDPAPRFR